MKLSQGDFIRIPRIAYYEIERGLLARGAVAKFKRFMNLVELLGTVSLTDNTLEIAAEIYADLSQKGQVIEDDDIFIGATALEHNAVLVMNNVKHLSRLQGIQLENWAMQ